jgi:preprotein translocase subunit YajC
LGAISPLAYENLVFNSRATTSDHQARLPKYPENRFMISSAFAQTAAPAGPEGTLIGMLPILLMFGLLYFLMIRPQMKKGKEQKSMIEALQKGDEVIAMGIIGKIVKVSDGYVSLEVGDGKIIHMQKGAVSILLPKGTFNDVTK